mmetsp:Transcript_37594/g.86801  ORF Transcript_37594/g.86801 Transcript_37594/m.86801 type:complete len:300 (-) Transcript_37594:327-1226(-)
MVGVLLWWHGIDEVGIQEEVVHIKILVGIDHGGPVIGCRQYPSVAVPGVGHLLVPTVVELETSPVVVAQHAEPRLVAEAGTLIDAFEDLIELMLCRISNLVHGRPAGLLNAPPVEVVAHVQDVLRIFERCAGFEGVGHQHLRLIVHPGHIATRRITRRLATRVEAFHQLRVATKLHSVHLVPAAPWKDTWPGPAAPVIRHDGGTTLRRVQRTIHATPVANGKDVHLLCAVDDGGGPGLAFVAHGGLWRYTAHTLVVAITAGTHARIDLVACKAVIARWIRASCAWRHAAKGVTWRSTEV